MRIDKARFWNGLNNEQKASTNLLLESDIAEKDIDGQAVILVRVPRADRTIRPVCISDNPKRGSYRRNGDGDYHCVQEELRAMMRDSAEGATDKLPLPNIGLEDLAQETIRTYRTVFDNSRPDHPWSCSARRGISHASGCAGPPVRGWRYPPYTGWPAHVWPRLAHHR
jgi:ATP-dependent DNA helicase RecG